MSDGRRFIVAVIQNGSVDYLRKATEELFLEDELIIFQQVKTHLRRYGAVPSLETVETEAGEELPDATEPVEYYYQRIINRKLYNEYRDRYRALQSAMRENDMEAAGVVVDDLKRVSGMYRVNDDIKNLQLAGNSVILRYDEVHGNVGMEGVTTGWTRFDETVGRYQNGDLVTIVARLGIGKTNVAIHKALAAWHEGYSVLFVTMEMTIEQIARRALGMYTGINPDFIRKGKLSTYAARRLGSAVENLNHSERFNIFAGAFSTKASDISVLIHEFSPDIIYIDGAYLVTPSGGRKMSRFERIAESQDEIKRMTIVHDRPIVQTMQFSRQAGKRGKEGSLENISFTDAVGMNSSIVYSIKEGPPPHQKTRRIIEVLKGREGEAGEFQINYTFTPMNFGEVDEDIIRDESVDLDWMGG